jgi:hypothetical protein
MCCFSAKTEVHGTSIFARLLKQNTQGLVYQMRYTAERPTAMILPLPVALPAREDSVRFKNLEGYPSFFDHLANGFPAKPSFSLSRSKSASVSEAASTLEVHDVGDYIATFVPSVKDFGRVDPQFSIAKDVWDKIPGYADYGFAVFQLKKLSGAPHPIALEFDTRLAQTIFFPTVHIHDGSVHEKDDFDHVLYTQETTFDERVSSYDGPDTVDSKTGFVRSKERATAFTESAKSQGLIDPNLLVHKMTMRGTLPNRDTVFDLRTILATRTSGCSRCDAGPSSSFADASLPTVATVGALGWIIRRRDRLSGLARGKRASKAPR